jgi:hypothetical protein
MSEKVKVELRRQRARLLEAESLGDERDLRPRDLSDEVQVATLLRSLCTRNPKRSPWRAPYSYMLVEEKGADVHAGELSLCGYVRGKALSANMLVHVTGVGSFEVARIQTARDPCPVNVKHSATPHVETLICERDETRADRLEGEVQPLDDEDDDDDDGEYDGDGCAMDQGDDVLQGNDAQRADDLEPAPANKVT